MTSQVELGRFFQQVRAYQAAPGSRTKAHHDGAGPQAADELALVTEMLLTAEEELRVQSEQLSATRLELDRVYARNEELFGAAPTAYVITDTDGLVVDANRAAWKLLGFRTASGARRPMVSMIAAQDRHRARTLVRQAVAAGGKSVTADLTLAAGLDRDEAVRDVVVNDVVVSVAAHTEPQSGTTLLRWQLMPISDEPEAPLPRLMGADSLLDRATGPAPSGMSTPSR